MKYIPHNRLSHDDAESDAAARVVASGYWAGGAEVTALESALCGFFDVKYAVCVGSGIAALRLALLSQGKQGMCAVPAYSCVALANAALAAGYTPYPVDIPKDSFNIILDSYQCETAIIVNSFGMPADIQTGSCFTIEDCSHGFSYDYEERSAQISGEAGIISFYATKLIGGGEGGVILTNNESLADFVREWRDYTDKSADGTRLNDKMSDIHAAVILAQFKKLPDFLAKRRELAKRYTDEFSELKHFVAPEHFDDRVYYRYALKKRGQADLNHIIQRLEQSSISSCEPVELWIDNPEDFPNAVDAYKTTLSIPLYPSLTGAEQDHIIKTIREIDEQLD